jgi:DNA-binding response OmpR family regulator
VRILIAEDDSALSDGLASCLRQAGHSVEQAADGEAALRALADEAI